MADKQALFKVIKDLSLDDCSLTLSPEPSVASHANSSPEPGARYQAQLDFEDGDDIQLLDLEADDDDDDDFLAEQLDAEAFSQAFMRSATPERALLPPSAAASTTNAAPTTSASVAGVVGASGAAVSGRVPAANGSGLLRTESTAASTAGAAYSNTAAEEAASLAAIADPPRIRVIVRKRPLNKKEIERGEADVLECDPGEA